MLFNSLAFAVFLPSVLAIYWSLRSTRRQNLFLLLASLFFYGWWDYRFVSLLLVSTLTDYFCGLGIGRAHARQAAGRPWLIVSLIVNLGMLGVFKYYDFFVESAEPLWLQLGWRPDLLAVVLPVGISFYTFQTLSYTIDIYRKKFEPRRNLIDVAAYVTFFPQLVAGPIERAATLMPQMERPRSISAETIRLGLMLMLVGFVKKLVIADGIAPVVGEIYGRAAQGESISAYDVVLGGYGFAFQVYGDFSGYSDIARGAARLLGFNLMINFRQPFFSRTTTEIWTRWNISLSTWLRDYLYVGLGGSRGGKARTLINLAATMLLGGLWHGAAWNYVAWGGLAGLYLVVERLLNIHDYRPWGTLRRAFGIVMTFQLFSLALVVFRSGGLETAGFMLSTLFGGPWALPSAGMAAAIAGAGLLIAFLDLPHLLHPSEELPCAHRRGWTIATLGVAAVCFLMFPPLDSQSFIYFQF